MPEFTAAEDTSDSILDVISTNCVRRSVFTRKVCTAISPLAEAYAFSRPLHDEMVAEFFCGAMALYIIEGAWPPAREERQKSELARLQAMMRIEQRLDRKSTRLNS